MDVSEYMEQAILPRLRGDGGWADVLLVRDGTVRLQLQGECSKCNIVPRCLAWAAAEIQRDLGVQVTIEYVRKKPFFWDQA